VIANPLDKTQSKISNCGEVQGPMVQLNVITSLVQIYYLLVD